MFQAFVLDNMRIWQTNKQTKTIITTYKEFLGTGIKSKGKAYIQYLSTSENYLN